MSMLKKDFIALADTIRDFNANSDNTGMDGFLPFSVPQITAIAAFCKSQNSNFMRNRWLDYIAGNCGKNGGAIKTPTCECSDPGCPAHSGKSTCSRSKKSTVYRLDMEDRTGTWMCEKCAADALNSGVFYTK